VAALTVPRVAFCAKAARVCAWRAAFYTKAPAIDVMGNCDRPNRTSLIVVAHIVSDLGVLRNVLERVPDP
jgi:hypothetical protein